MVIADVYHVFGGMYINTPWTTEFSVGAPLGDKYTIEVKDLHSMITIVDDKQHLAGGM